MHTATHNESGQAFSQLEPRGTQVQLRDLLRWRLAAEHIPLENRRNSSHLTGGRRSTLRGRGVDFDEVRLYQPGDDVRAIDWRVTARIGKPHTKIFREEKERPVLLVVDLRSTMMFGSRRCFKSVLAAHAAALLAWATLAAGDRVGALLVSDHGITDIKPRRSRHTVLQLLRQLTGATSITRATSTTSPISWQTATQQLAAVVRPGSCVIQLGDFHDWNDDCARALHGVVRHSQVFALQVSDTLEEALPSLGLVSVHNHQKRSSINTHDRVMLESFRLQQQQQKQQLQSSLRKLRIPLQALQTGNPIFPALRSFFVDGKTGGVQQHGQ